MISTFVAIFLHASTVTTVGIIWKVCGELFLSRADDVYEPIVASCRNPDCQERVKNVTSATCRFVTIVLLDHAKAAIRVPGKEHDNIIVCKKCAKWRCRDCENVERCTTCKKASVKNALVMLRHLQS